jgi:putative transposase
MLERKAYRFRLDPTPEQAHAFECCAGARRFVYNWALARCREYYKATEKGLPWTQLSAELTALKYQPGFEWLQDLDAQLLQQALADLRRAFINFFETRAGYPRFKRKKSVRQSFRFPQRVRVEAGKVSVPKISWVRMRQSRPIDGTIKGATFKRDATGKWSISLVVEWELADRPLPQVTCEDVLGSMSGLRPLLPCRMEQRSRILDSIGRHNGNCVVRSGCCRDDIRGASGEPKPECTLLTSTRRLQRNGAISVIN